MTEADEKKASEMVKEILRRLSDEPPACLGQKCYKLGSCDYGLACVCIWCEKHPYHGTFLRKIYNKIRAFFKA